MSNFYTAPCSYIATVTGLSKKQCMVINLALSGASLSLLSHKVFYLAQCFTILKHRATCNIMDWLRQTLLIHPCMHVLFC